MQPIKPDTLVACLTVEQLTSLLHDIFPQKEQIKESLPEYFGIETFCEITGYKKNTVYQLVRQKKIPVYRAAHGGKKLMPISKKDFNFNHSFIYFFSDLH